MLAIEIISEDGNNFTFSDAQDKTELFTVRFNELLIGTADSKKKAIVMGMARAFCEVVAKKEEKCDCPRCTADPKRKIV